MPCSSARRGWPSMATGSRCSAAVDGHPVAVRQGNVVAVAFHPELAGETRLHELLLGMNGRGQAPAQSRAGSRWRCEYARKSRSNAAQSNVGRPSGPGGRMRRRPGS